MDHGGDERGEGRRCGAARHALREVAERETLGLVFFEANRTREGAARPLRSWVEAFPEWQAAEFGSQNLWGDRVVAPPFAALLRHVSRGAYALHVGWCCPHPGSHRRSATLGYCELWEHDEVPIEFAADENWSDALDEALSVDWSVLQHHATWLHDRYRQSFDGSAATWESNPASFRGKRLKPNMSASRMDGTLRDSANGPGNAFPKRGSVAGGPGRPRREPLRLLHRPAPTLRHDAHLLG